MDTLISVLLPMGIIITRISKEAEKLLVIWRLKNVDDMKKAAEVIGRNLSGSVLIKGGHLTETADDLYTMTVNLCGIAENVSTIEHPRTGCFIICHRQQSGFGLHMKTSTECEELYHGALKDGLDSGGKPTESLLISIYSEFEMTEKSRI